MNTITVLRQSSIANPHLPLQTLGWRQPLPNVPGDVQPQHRQGRGRIFPTKAIRIVSLAPDLSDKRPDTTSRSDPTPGSAPADDGSFHSERQHPPADEFWRSQAGLLQLVSMIGGDVGDDEEEEDDEEGVIVADFHDGEINGEWVDDEEDDDPDAGSPNAANEHESQHPHSTGGV